MVYSFLKIFKGVDILATDKNITMKQFNGTDYDTLYPKTIASQIPDVYSKPYIDSILKNNARIQTGSYVGTGTSGANNPCTLTFDFTPKFMCIMGGGPAMPCSGYFVYDFNGYITFRHSANPRIEGSALFSNNKISWSANGALFQLNEKDYIYYYVAIG